MRPSPDLVRDLAQRIRALESTSRPNPALPLRIPLLDALLPKFDLPAGSLIELLAAADGGGAWTCALLLAKHACAERPAYVVIDPLGRFYPLAATRIGLDLRHAIVVRPAKGVGIQTAFDLSLRCPAVGATLGWYDRMRGTQSQCLKWAAEAGGGLGLLVRPGSALKNPSFADVRLLVAPLASADRARRVRIEVVRWRAGTPGRAVGVEIDDETGDVRVSAGLAAPTTGARPPRAAP